MKTKCIFLTNHSIAGTQILFPSICSSVLLSIKKIINEKYKTLERIESGIKYIIEFPPQSSLSMLFLVCNCLFLIICLVSTNYTLHSYILFCELYTVPSDLSASGSAAWLVKLKHRPNSDCLGFSRGLLLITYVTLGKLSSHSLPQFPYLSYGIIIGLISWDNLNIVLKDLCKVFKRVSSEQVLSRCWLILLFLLR